MPPHRRKEKMGAPSWDGRGFEDSAGPESHGSRRDDGSTVGSLVVVVPYKSAVESRIREWEWLGRNSEFSDGRRFRAEGVTYTRARRRGVWRSRREI